MDGDNQYRNARINMIPSANQQFNLLTMMLGKKEALLQLISTPGNALKGIY